MRLDRFITLNIVRPFRHALAPRRSTFDRSLPILMYHSISDDPEPGVRPYYRVCTGLRRFREQMQWLKDNGYRGVTLGEGLNLKSEVRSQPSAFRLRPVVLTFDDGFRDFYTSAWPILREFGFAATMYLPTAFIGETRRLFAPCPRRGEVNSSSNGGRECLTWAEVKQLHRAGIEFGSHTVNHPKLVELPWSAVELEIQNSKLEIEAHLNVPCATFAYPYAFPGADRAFVGKSVELLKAGGYETCVTTQLGRYQPGDDVLQIKRLPINSGDDVGLFQAKLEGSYDWLAPLQSGVKKIKSALSLKQNPNHAVSPISQVPAAK